MITTCKTLLALTTTLGITAITGCDTNIRQELPNFVIFLADDLGYGDLSTYGHPLVKTPHLDRFASQGVLLTDCHSAGTVSSPSRAGMLTGRNPYRSGFSYIAGGKTYLRDEEVTLAELLRKRGYQTAFFGKWHLSNLRDSLQPDPGDQGFDYWLATSVNAFEGPENPLHFIRNGERTGTLEGWYCDIIVRESLEWLARIDKRKPFLLVICTHEPHTPLDPPDSLAAPFLDPAMAGVIQGMNYGGVDREGRFSQERAAQYYGTVVQLDQAFGTFIDGLDAYGFKDNSLVFFTSDNGPEHPVNLEESLGEWDDPIRENCYGTPGIFRGMKRYPYEGGHRVPGIVRWPTTIPANTVSGQLINGTDLLPTFCELAGVAMPDDRPIDGEPALNALLGKPLEREKPVLWVFPAHGDTWFRMPHLALREGQYVLTGRFRDKTGQEKINEWLEQAVPERFELYDITTDPGQVTDISLFMPEVKERLSNEMILLWKEVREEYTLVSRQQ